VRQLFRRYPRQFWLMIAGVVISNAGGSMVWPFLLIYVSAKLDLPLTAVATLVTIQAGTSILASFGAGTLADRAGRRVVMVASLLGSSLVYLFLLGASSYVEFALLMAVQGVSNPLYQVGADAMLADLVPPQQRTEAYSITRIASNAGFGMGPAVGGLLVTTSYHLAFLGASAGFLAYAVLLLLRARETLVRPAARPGARRIARPAPPPVAEPAPPVAEPARPPGTSPAPFPPVGAPAAGVAPQGRRRGGAPVERGYGHVLRDRRYVAFIGLIGTGLIAPAMMWILLAVYTKTNFGLSESLYGWIPTTNAVMCVLVQYPVTRISSRYPPLAVVTVGMAVYAVGAGSVALMSGFWGFWASMVILTFGELLLIPTASKYIADLAPSDLRGRYMSLWWLSHGASRAVAPLVGGFLNDQIAPAAIWYGALAIGMTSAGGLAALARRTRQRAAWVQGTPPDGGSPAPAPATLEADSGRSR
jgi:MFS family permease